MCISDWRIGRQIRTQATDFTGGTGLSLVFQPSMQRVGLSVAQKTASAVSTLGTSVTFLNGAVFSMALSTLWLHFTLQTHGDLVTRGFTVASIGAGPNCSVIEYFLPEEVLMAGLEEFRRMYKW